MIDDNRPDTASRVASGIINPVTGRRVVRTWMIEELLPFAIDAYRTFGEELGAPIAREIDLLTFHSSEQMKSAWHDRIAEGEDYISYAGNSEVYSAYFETGYGVGVTAPCMLVDVQLMMKRWREVLSKRNAILEQSFEIAHCIVTDKGVQYGDIYAEKLILCNGIDGFDNQYFGKLPYTLNKGEALLARIPGLPPTNIYKQAVSIVPVEGDLFWIGSSFEWEFEHDRPTEAFRQKTESILKKWLKLPYSIEDHRAAIRPASLERRPFVGMHPLCPNVGIFNGMGTKGCSLAPYFSAQLTAHLLKNDKIDINADVQRFNKLLTIGGGR